MLVLDEPEGDRYVLTSSHPLHNYSTSSASPTPIQNHFGLLGVPKTFIPNPFHSYPPSHIFFRPEEADLLQLQW